MTIDREAANNLRPVTSAACLFSVPGTLYLTILDESLLVLLALPLFFGAVFIFSLVFLLLVYGIREIFSSIWILIEALIRSERQSFWPSGKSGRYGGTCAHKELDFEFWVLRENGNE